MINGKPFVRREYEQQALVAVRQIRQMFWFWCRRGRKSTNLGAAAFDEISKGPGRMAIAASASLLLGSELVTVTLSQAEQAMIVSEEANAVKSALAMGAEEKGLDLQFADSGSGKPVQGLTADDFAEMYRASRLELRLYYDHTSYSRLQVIAPNPATARGWRALVIRDEVGYTSPQFETALQIATDAIMRDTPDLKILYASNLPADNRHPAFTMTLPRDITAATEEEQFPANPKGHFYIGSTGMMVHRVALKDAYAAGHRLFDDHGQPMTYEEAIRFGPVKLGLDISYTLNHKSGGTSAIDLIALLSAQRRGIELGCSFVFVDNDADFRRALDLLRANLTNGPVGIGVDVASTTGATSNPTSVSVMERVGQERPIRLIVCWKEKREAMQRERLREILRVVRERRSGSPAQKLCIDGSNERLFAEGTATELRGIVSVDVIVASETVEPVPPGYEKTGVNYKTYTGDRYAMSVNEGRVPLPSHEYVKQDHMLPIKDAGRYVCTPEPNGMHGDTFDSSKLAELSLDRRSTGIDPNTCATAGLRSTNHFAGLGARR